MKQLFFVLFFLVSIFSFSQLTGLTSGNISDGQTRSLDSTSNEVTVKLSGKTKYTDYKIISIKRDTTIIDTTLTIQKEYKYNFRRKDNFELLEFHNQGQTFTNLAYDFNNISLFPDIGYRAKQFLYMNIDDINYYHVPTPTTEILYKTGLQQGQVLDALFTLNFSKRLNVSIAYKGLRSLGQYRQSLSSTGNFRSTLTYSTPKDQYRIRMHATFQDFTNEESGGIADEMVEAFETDNESFINREVIDVNLDDTENIFKGTRLYIDHNYKLFSSKDSTNQKDFSNLKVGHILQYEKKSYKFTQGTSNSDIFGASYISSDISEDSENLLTNNQAYLEFNSKYILGKFKAKANYTTVNYGYNSIYNPNLDFNKIKLKGDAVSVGAEWRGKIGRAHV